MTQSNVYYRRKYDVVDIIERLMYVQFTSSVKLLPNVTIDIL